MTVVDRERARRDVQRKWRALDAHLNERTRRLWAASEASVLGYGGVSLVAAAIAMNRNTIMAGLRELGGAPAAAAGRIRRPGGGRKKATVTDDTLLADLDDLIEPKGDPQSLIRWTTKSLAHLTNALGATGHTIKKSALATLLKQEGFSLKANKKNIEGVSHPDRDPQFRHIQATCEAFATSGDPIISVDCKKKELIGTFKNQGREWQPQGKNTTVNVYDFLNLADGKAVPYGVYDIIHNTGFVNVGVDHDTAAFAVESIRRWWQSVGSAIYQDKRRLLITSDGGGSNGVRNRLWKIELQKLANETGLSITVNHLPPATSKWNKIEHRLFAYISINWRGRPLTSLETVIELISSTKTTQGLTVQAVVDQHTYPTGIKVSNEEMERLNITRDGFHGEWNYTIAPQG
jgi:Rhodopirellula transposase DDE domain